ncbi:MAG: pyridoxamine 5'-phosphate oxidase family protein [Acidimicrobiales bacterium]|nr:pyridoxamine 5'-phosphate oxidase family protein [Acidimicrobiales bacterium]
MGDKLVSVELEELDENECLSLLGEVGIGRLGFVDEGEVYIFPVNYVREAKSIAFRTGEGSHLYHTLFTNVALEIDSTDALSHEGWSVLVKGVGHLMTDAIDDLSRRLKMHGYEPWAPGAKGQWIRIDKPVITGRRIVHKIKHTETSN